MKTDELSHSITGPKMQAETDKILEEKDTPEEVFLDQFYKFKEYIAQNLTDQVLHDEWYNLFIKEPENFFKNIDGLRAMDRNKRILFLIKQFLFIFLITS